MATIWGASYSKAYVDFTREGGAISCAVKTGTDPLEVYFKRSGDGVTWPDDSAAVLVGTLGTTNKACHCHQKHPSGSARMVVTNGADKMWESSDYGKTWSAV